MTEMTDQADQSPNVPETIAGSAIPPAELERITDDIIAALKTVYDPEIPADIYELGLVYKIDIDDEHFVNIDMTLTAPGCGMGDVIANDARDKLMGLPHVGEVDVQIVFDPPWDRSRMSEAALLTVGL